MVKKIGKLQAYTLWEQILNRLERIEMMCEPQRVLFNFVIGDNNVSLRVQ